MWRDAVVIGGGPAGRALGREHLDTLLLDRAAASGAEVWQPYTAVDIDGAPGRFTCTIAPARSRASVIRLQTSVLIKGSALCSPSC